MQDRVGKIKIELLQLEMVFAITRDKMYWCFIEKLERCLSETERKNSNFPNRDTQKSSDLPQPTTLNSVLMKVACYAPSQCANCCFYCVVVNALRRFRLQSRTVE